MSRHSNKWIVDAYLVHRLTIEQISDIVDKPESDIRSILLKNRAIGNTKRLKKVSIRKRNKRAALFYLGDRCKRCKYNRCEAALEFHHLYGKDKSYNVSSGFNLPWKELKIELDKCMLVCCNCHKEIHHEKRKK